MVLLQETLQVDMLQARQHEKDLQLRHDEASATKHAGAMLLIGRALEALQAATAAQPAARQAVQQAAASILRYGAEFEVLNQQLRELGLDENKGLQGVLRAAIREVEASTAKVDGLAVQVSFLTLRRHEKDYLARSAARYVTQLQAEMPKLAAALDAAGVDPGERRLLTARVDAYRDAFLRLVEGRTRLGHV